MSNLFIIDNTSFCLQVMKCPKTNSTGGPVISLETTDKTDDMAIVWMSITSPDSPIAGYRIYLNGTMCGNQVGD